jgi:hypothetical protein
MKFTVKYMVNSPIPCSVSLEISMAHNVVDAILIERSFGKLNLIASRINRNRVNFDLVW